MSMTQKLVAKTNDDMRPELLRTGEAITYDQ